MSRQQQPKIKTNLQLSKMAENQSLESLFEDGLSVVADSIAPSSRSQVTNL